MLRMYVHRVAGLGSNVSALLMHVSVCGSGCSSTWLQFLLLALLGCRSECLHIALEAACGGIVTPDRFAHLRLPTDVSTWISSVPSGSSRDV